MKFRPPGYRRGARPPRLRPAARRDLSGAVDARRRRLGGDRDRELAPYGAAVGGHRFRLSLEPRGHLVVNGVGAGPNRRHLPDRVLGLPRRQRPELERVGLSGGGAGGGHLTEVLGRGTGRKQLRVAVLEDPHRPVRAGEVGFVQADVERAIGLRPPGWLGSLAGVDRHREVGDRLVADVLDRELEVAGLDETLLIGELRLRHLDREAPRRLGDVLALAPTARRDAQCHDKRGQSGSDTCFRAPESLPLGLCGARPQGAEQHTTDGGSNRRPDRYRALAVPPRAVRGGGERPHGIHCLSAAAARGPEEKMVRTVADRAFLPAKSLFEQVGNMMILTGKTITATVRPPFPYGGEFISQFIFALQLCWFPMLISTVAFGFGAPGLQAANFLTLFGALDRLGGFFILASIREFAPFVTAVIVAGVAGTAITPDLGERKIREELDALQVLGVDPIKNLVVPRFLSLMLITGLMDVYALLFGISGGIFAEIAYHQPLGGFFATLFANASITDLWGSLVKCTLFGAIIAIVCCYKGMNASGGAEGVGRAVNEAVVIAFLGVFAFNYAFTQTLLATHPELNQIR